MVRIFKRFSPVVVVGVLVTIVCLVLFLWNPPFIQAIYHYAYDALLRRVSREQMPKSDKVVIVDIDDFSMADEDLGQWPWPRYLVAQLTDRIFEAGASVIAYDILFAEKDRTSPNMLTSRLKAHFNADVAIKGLPDEARDFDQVFARSLTNGNAILGIMMRPVDTIPESVDGDIDPEFSCCLSFAGTNPPMKDLVQSDLVTMPILELNKVAHTAFFNALVDLDGVVRRNPLIWAYGRDRLYPAMALEAVRLDKGIAYGTILYDDQGIVGIRLGKFMIPTDKAGRIVVNYRSVDQKKKSGFFSTFPTYSAKDVIDGKIGHEELGDKIVFIGTSAAALKDLRATPVTQHFSGVEIHATMVDNILAGDMLLEPNYMYGVQAIFIFLTGIALSVLISRGRSWISFLVSVAMVWIAYISSRLLMERYSLVFVPVWVIITVVFVYLVLTMIKFWQEELQKKKVRDMFGTMVSEDVLTYLEKNPGSFSLSGQKAEATMLFSDIQGFTTISESLEPSQLSELLNKYLSPMTHIIMNRRGYVDKYEGDAIMAEWGVPFPMQDHAVQACLAALEQQEELARIRPALVKEFGHELHVRIGINSGTVTAGNMGSDRRFQYTVMGDPVNQAARFEPANKDYGTLIIIGESTYNAAKGEIEARMLDKLIVQGKTKPIVIYELYARAGEASDTRMHVVELYEEGLKAHWRRDWDAAETSFHKALELDPQDGPCARLIQRINEYRKNPPAEGWSGEHIRTTKD